MNNKDLLCYCWKHKLLNDCCSIDGKQIEIIDQGLFNRNEGCSFFNAKVRIDNLLMVGNVQVLENSSEWAKQGLDRDYRYDNVILIITYFADIMDFCLNSKGQSVPVAVCGVPSKVANNAETLTSAKGQRLCKGTIMQYTSMLTRHSWLAAMQTECLEERVEHIRLLQKQYRNWDDTFFVCLFRGFGFGFNEDRLEQLAKSIPADALTMHRDDLFQLEAIILGQAGLLDLEAVPEKFQKQALMEGYFAKLRHEYLYLAAKFSMKATADPWKPFGKGQQVYPHVILSMIADFIYVYGVSSQSVLNLKTPADAAKWMLEDKTICNATVYWQTHYHFGAVSSKSDKPLSANRRAMFLTSFVVPFLFCYGRMTDSEELCDRAFAVMEQVRPFSTSESNGFSEFGLEPSDAGQTVALTHLQRKYCSRHDCLRCRFGFEFIKKH